MRHYILFFLLFYSLFTQGQSYVESIPDYETYQKLKGKPLSDKFSNIESVKVIFSLQNDKLYFFNSSLIAVELNGIFFDGGFLKN